MIELSLIAVVIVFGLFFFGKNWVDGDWEQDSWEDKDTSESARTYQGIAGNWYVVDPMGKRDHGPFESSQEAHAVYYSLYNKHDDVA